MAMKITLPSLTPIIVITFLGALGRIFNAEFGQFLMVPMESPMLADVTSVLDTYVYNSLKGSADIGMGAAAGLFQSVAGFTLVLLVNVFIRRKFGKEMAMF
jgi:putative aldouronate transport system permease protein